MVLPRGLHGGRRGGRTGFDENLLAGRVPELVGGTGVLALFPQPRLAAGTLRTGGVVSPISARGLAVAGRAGRGTAGGGPGEEVQGERLDTAVRAKAVEVRGTGDEGHDGRQTH